MYLSKDALASLTDDLNDEVPRLSRLQIREEDELGVTDVDAGEPAEGGPGECTPVFYTIPRDEWEHTEAGFDAARQLQERLDRLDPARKLNVSVTDIVNGQRSRKASPSAEDSSLFRPGTPTPEAARSRRRCSGP